MLVEITVLSERGDRYVKSKETLVFMVRFSSINRTIIQVERVSIVPCTLSGVIGA